MDRTTPALLESNLQAATVMVPLYRCPEYQGLEFVRPRGHSLLDNKCAVGNYVALGASTIGHLWGVELDPDGANIPGGRIGPRVITDGLSHTVFIVERRDELPAAVWAD